MALELMTKGYVVIDRSRTTAIVSEQEFYGSGLNDKVRNALQAQKLTAVVFGSINDFSCDANTNTVIFANPGRKKNRAPWD